MADPLNVNLVDLHASADRLDMHRGDLMQAHGAANASIEGSMSGWVGTSAAALRAKMTDLTAADAHIAEELSRHDGLLRHAAYNYGTVDDNAMAAFIRTGQAL